MLPSVRRRLFAAKVISNEKLSLRSNSRVVEVNRDLFFSHSELIRNYVEDVLLSTEDNIIPLVRFSPEVILQAEELFRRFDANEDITVVSITDLINLLNFLDFLISDLTLKLLSKLAEGIKLIEIKAVKYNLCLESVLKSYLGFSKERLPDQILRYGNALDRFTLNGSLVTYLIDLFLDSIPARLISEQLKLEGYESYYDLEIAVKNPDFLMTRFELEIELRSQDTKLQEKLYRIVKSSIRENSSLLSKLYYSHFNIATKYAIEVARDSDFVINLMNSSKERAALHHFGAIMTAANIFVNTNPDADMKNIIYRYVETIPNGIDTMLDLIQEKLRK